jgi:hypothetical protein
VFTIYALVQTRICASRCQLFEDLQPNANSNAAIKSSLLYHPSPQVQISCDHEMQAKLLTFDVRDVELVRACPHS